MHFLPDVYVPCDVCKGKRYNRETLEVRYKGKNISDVLDMTVEEALEFFRNLPKIRDKLQTLLRRGPGLREAGPVLDDAVRRRGAAREAGDGTGAARPTGTHGVRPGRADDGPAHGGRAEAHRRSWTAWLMRATPSW